MTIEESYKVLKLKPGATEDEIRSSYKKLIKQFHPDTYKGDKEEATLKTIQINQAYRILTFKEKPTPSPKNTKKSTKKKFSFFNFFKNLFKKKTKQEKVKKEQKEPKKQEKTQKNIKKSNKNDKIKLENNKIAPEIILIGIMAIILIFLVIWFLAAGK